MTASYPPPVKILLPLFFIVFWLISSGSSASAQSTTQIRIRVTPPETIEIEGVFDNPRQRWSLPNALAGTTGLADRVREFSVVDEDGQALVVRKLATGEYQSNQAGRKFRYQLRIPEPKNNEVAHLSSLNAQLGVLFLRDLLPIGINKCLVQVEVPPNWSTHSSAQRETKESFRISNPDKEVFLVGEVIAKSEKKVAGMRVQLLVPGRFPVSDKAILKSSERVLERYAKLTGKMPSSDALIAVVPFRFATGSNRWKAETIGNTSLLFIDPSSTFSNWKGQFGVIFTHELFHLWVPNALSLEGGYDWFFEGFTLYTALLTSLKLDLISFQEYLNTIARVYDSYLSYPDLALIDASERRWLGNGAAVYDKGMLTAFLYDLRIRRETHSAKTVTDLYRPLFSESNVGSLDANEVIIRLLGRESNSFSRTSIDSALRLDLDKALLDFGLHLDSTGSTSKITVAKPLTAAQEHLVKSLRDQN